VTCIVGIEHPTATGGRVYIGGDSACVASYDLTIRSDAKVFRNGPYVMGFTTSFRMGQILRYKLEAPDPGGTEDLERFMATTFIDAVRTSLTDAGWMKKENSREEGGTFLVGVAGALFAVHSDFQVARTLTGYDAVGCGSDLALGALYATRGRSPGYRLGAALRAAEHHSTGVAGPFTIEVAK